MVDQKDFLVEIGTEELPPKSLKKLSTSFMHNVIAALKEEKLAHHEIEIFATPRRLAILINNLQTEQADQFIERNGPFKSVAFDKDGKPTPAALGFAKSCGVSFEKLEYTESEKGQKLYFKQQQAGKPTKELLPKIVEQALEQLPVNKPMRWGSSEIKFVRPVHWVLMVLGNETVEGKVLGKKIDNKTFGHRFHYPDALTIKTPNKYAEILEEKAYVIASFEKRRQKIKAQLEKEKENVVIDESLLDEVTGLVEWPVTLKGNFDKRFLVVPEEALITTMKSNQKCFSLVDKSGKLLPNFMTVSNIESKDKNRVIKGNERVIQARLSDAEFFYQQDIKHGFEQNVERLKDVVFQAKLGTMHSKKERIKTVAEFICEKIKANKKDVLRAAELCKADLLTDMVGEFPELQGIMGNYYALNKGENETVSLAIREHYLPKHAGDMLPETLEGCAIAIADKIDTLIGIFGINQAPTGVKDPYGLRRAAIGVLRIIIEKKLTIDLKELLDIAQRNYSAKLENKDVVTQCFNFITDRLKSYYHDHGITTDIFSAVAARNPTALLDFHNRVKAVQHFKNLPEAKALAAANKRVSNILKKQELDFSKNKIDERLFKEPAEKNLSELLKEKNNSLTAYFKDENYTEALTQLASLQKPVDQFFDDVMVMTEDESLRINRLTLLNNLRSLFLQIADISLLQQS